MISASANKSNSKVYKYSANMIYILKDTKIEVDMDKIRSIAIDSNYKEMNMPMIFITAFIHKDHVDIIQENQNEGIFILNIRRAIRNTDMPDIFSDYINDKFIYFISRGDTAVEAHGSDGNEDGDLYGNERDDVYELVSLGLLSLDHINKNKKVINGVVTGELSSLMYYATNHLPIVIEPPVHNKTIENQFLPPMNSVSKTLEYLNSISVFYDTPYRFFIDFDCSYLLSSSGKGIRKKGENINTVFLTIRDSDNVSAKIEGMTINNKLGVYEIDINDSDCEIADNHISGKSYSKVLATGASGTTFNKNVTDITKSGIKNKTRTIRINNENSGIIDNMISSINSSSIQLLVQKTDIDTSALTMNKEYIIQADEVYDKEKYNGRYILTRKRELYIRINDIFTLDTMLLFEKV